MMAPAFNTVAILLVMLLVLVAQMAEWDRSTLSDANHYRWLRRVSLYGGALTLLIVVETNLWGTWEPNLYGTLPVASAVFILFINWLILAKRQQPVEPPPLPRSSLVARGLSSDATRRIDR